MPAKQEIKRKVLITGASGLLGSALVNEFASQGFDVLGQYRYHRPPSPKIGNCVPLPGDFSDLTGIRAFLQWNQAHFAGCGVLINNYGPIIYKDITALRGEDFCRDYFQNVVPAFEITDYFLKHFHLQVVVNIGFEYTGEVRPYQKILTYAAAKNALQLITVSFEKSYPDIRFVMIPVPTLAGATVPAAHKTDVLPATVAKEIYQRVNL